MTLVSSTAQPRQSSPTEGGRLEALVGASAAALTAGAGMLVLRSAAEVRSIPERLMEALLLLVPTSVFERLLQRFGFDAKRYGLDAAIVVCLVVLGGIGYLALRRRCSVGALALLGIGFWLAVMLIIMPLTSAGLFASALTSGTLQAVLGYLAVGLSYAAALGLASAWLRLRARRTAALYASSAYRRILAPAPVLAAPERRLLFGLIGGAMGGYIAAYASALLVPRSPSVPSILLIDPQQPVPSGGIAAPNPHPQTVASAVPEPASGPPTPAASDSGLPEPGAARDLQRDKDGAVLPSGRQPGQLAPAITSNTDFYVVSKNAGGDPVLHPGDWRLLIDGEVAQSFQLDYPTLRRLPAVEVTKTLECISNMVGKPELAPFGAELISTARWKGVRVSDILNLAGGPNANATWLAVLSADEYISTLPMNVALDPETLLAYDMNGQTLPREHGYPARLLVPDRYGMKNAKWVVGLRPMSREVLDWYGQRNWSTTGIVQTMTRIDAPAAGASLAAGTSTVAGVAYAGTRGIRLVEFSADGGTSWQPAELLEPPPGPDCWVRWRGSFTLQAGKTLTLLARATDGTGAVQPEAFRLPEPDGGTGWPKVQVG